MNRIEHYLYKNDKAVVYNFKMLETNDIFLKRDDLNVTVKINDVSVTLPKEKFAKILENKGGVVTVNKNQVKINKKKTCHHIDVTIRDAEGRFESSIIDSPHFNTPDWYQFKCFIEGKVPTMILSLCNPVKQYDGTVETNIGIGIYPLNMEAKSTREAVSLNNSEGFFQTVDSYSFQFKLESEYLPGKIESLKEKIRAYLEECTQPILVQNLDEIEKVLGLKLPADRLYSFDDLISYEDYEAARTHHVSKGLMVYGGSPHQSALTLSQLYFDREILKNPDNKLDKLIGNVNVIKEMGPVLHFDI